MASTHVLARIRNRTSENHGEKSLLFGDLPIHINVVEELTYPIVRKDLSVEDVNRGIDRGFASELVVQCWRRGGIHKDVFRMHLYGQ